MNNCSDEIMWSVLWKDAHGYFYACPPPAFRNLNTALTYARENLPPNTGKSSHHYDLPYWFVLPALHAFDLIHGTADSRTLSTPREGVKGKTHEMTPLVDRLRAQADTFRDTRCELLHEAADEIERLERCEEVIVGP